MLIWRELRKGLRRIHPINEPIHLPPFQRVYDVFASRMQMPKFLCTVDMISKYHVVERPQIEVVVRTIVNKHLQAG